MPYNIDRYAGGTTYVVEDGTIDSSLDIKLIGKNYAGYGEVQNENFVHLLENFSSNNAPPRPLSGQIWYDSSNKKLKFYDGTKFRTTGGAEISSTAPSGLTTGDFWWDTANEQLYSWNGTEFVLIGPLGVANAGTTQFRSRNVLDNIGGNHAIIEALVDGEVIYVISADEFTLNSSNPITGFSIIKKGLTLVYANPSTGINTTDHRYWGTAANADRLGGVSAANFVQVGSLNFSGGVTFDDVGFTVGNDNDLQVFIVGSDTPTIRNQNGTTIKFQTTVASVTQTPLTIVGNDIFPGVTAVTNIGSNLLKFNTIYANSFNGTATQSDSLNVGGNYRTASTAAGANTIAARDASGNLTANIFNGVATSARYADLAEIYATDKEYPVGTVMMIGGEAEATASKSGHRAIGVISEKPAYLMNSEAEGQAIALKGRVPTKFRGKVTKGDKLIGDSDGVAFSVGTTSHPDVFAIALESGEADDENDLIEAIIL